MTGGGGAGQAQPYQELRAFLESYGAGDNDIDPRLFDPLEEGEPPTASPDAAANAALARAQATVVAHPTSLELLVSLRDERDALPKRLGRGSRLASWAEPLAPSRPATPPPARLRGPRLRSRPLRASPRASAPVFF